MSRKRVSRDVISDEAWAVNGPLFPTAKSTGHPPVDRRTVDVAVSDRVAVAGRAGAVRELEHDLQELQPMGRAGRVGGSRCPQARAGPEDDRRWAGCRGSVAGARGVRADVRPVAESVRRVHHRSQLDERGALSSRELRTHQVGRRVEVSGLVTHRQHPATASGITLLNLEDEHGLMNVVCSKAVCDRYRRVLRDSPDLIARGLLERSPEGVANLVADGLRRSADRRAAPVTGLSLIYAAPLPKKGCAAGRRRSRTAA